MKELKINELTLKDFKSLGSFGNMVNPDSEKINVGENVDFYRDMISMNLGASNTISFSVCTVAAKKSLIDLVEYHSFTEETIMPINGDIAILLAPATPGSIIPFNEFKIYRIPAGMMVVLKSGVWHSGPFIIENEPVSILVALPERTYANDCIVTELDPEEQVSITGI